MIGPIEHPTFDQYIESGGEPIRAGCYRIRGKSGAWVPVIIRRSNLPDAEWEAEGPDGRKVNAETVWTHAVRNPIDMEQYKAMASEAPQEAKTVTTNAIECSAETDKLFAALAVAQGAFPAIPKNREVKVRSKSGAEYGFRYATLDCIIDTLRPVLAKSGLSVVQLLSGQVIATQLSHASGQWIRSHYPVVVENAGNQARGSAITYARRYAITALLNIAADEDDDGNEADGNEVKTKTEIAPKASPPAASVAKFFAGPDLHIAKGKADTWQAWTDRFIKAVTAAPNGDAVSRLAKDNGYELDGLNAENKKAAEVVRKAMAERIDALAGA